ncbi:MAG: hypothetical protein K8T25_21490 [Planctomycetia bacterium]|nr:hypothetical protein [Planctomycetia bacterium]
MNKAFVREPDSTADYCPRCGSEGEAVGAVTLAAQLTEAQRRGLSEPANFCPSPRCEVIYFDKFERFVLAADLAKPVYPKDPSAPICACFGLSCEDVERDVAEGGVTRVRAALEKAKSPEARCVECAPNGRSCVAFVQRYYMERRKQ